MSSGRLLSAFAFEVSPRQTAPFVGGAIPPTEELQGALDEIYRRSKIDSAPVVNFAVNTTPGGQRSHPIRDAARAVAFLTPADPSPAAALAGRLAAAMDNRSKSSLLMVTVHDAGRGSDRRVVTWTFPQQEVFSLNVSAGTASLVLLEAFNRESSLRKVAMVEGPNTNSGMLTARVLDFQAAAAERDVADLWIAKFLDARLQMNDTEGTQYLAQALRSAHTKTRNDVESQDQVLAAITGLRATSNLRQSLNAVADTYLSGAAREHFLASADPETRAAIFSLDRTRFDQLIQYKRFTLASGIVVSAPFTELGEDGAVQVTDVDGQRLLRIEGQITDEQVRLRA